MNVKTLLLIGRPGCGKGTQAVLLSEKTGWKTLSSGDKLREIRNTDTPLGRRVKEVYDAGKYLPDWFADYIFERDVFELTHTQGIVLEGFGRTMTQAEHITDICEWLGRPFQVIHINVPEDVAIARMLERAKTEQRPDSDTIDKIKIRLQKYDDNTKESVDFFEKKGIMKSVDGSQDVISVHNEILKIIQEV